MQIESPQRRESLASTCWTARRGTMGSLLKQLTDMYKLELREIERNVPQRLLSYKIPMDVAVRLTVLKSQILENSLKTERQKIQKIQIEREHLKRENKALKKSLQHALRTLRKVLKETRCPPWPIQEEEEKQQHQPQELQKKKCNQAIRIFDEPSPDFESRPTEKKPQLRYKKKSEESESEEDGGGGAAESQQSERSSIHQQLGIRSLGQRFQECETADPSSPPSSVPNLSLISTPTFSMPVIKNRELFIPGKVAIEQELAKLDKRKKKEEAAVLRSMSRQSMKQVKAAAMPAFPLFTPLPEQCFVEAGRSWSEQTEAEPESPRFLQKSGSTNCDDYQIRQAIRQDTDPQELGYGALMQMNQEDIMSFQKSSQTASGRGGSGFSFYREQ